MSDPTGPTPGDPAPGAPAPGDDPALDDAGPRRGVIIGLAVALVIAVLILVLVLLGRGDDDGELAETTEPTTTEEPVVTEPDATEPTEPPVTDPPPETTEPPPDETTTTTEPDATTTTTDAPEETTTTTAAPPPAPTPDELAAAVWPWGDADLRYDEPMAAVEGFVVDHLELGDPQYSEFMAGDANSGEVEVRTGTFIDPTIVSVRRFSDGTWWVLGASTANIVVDQPEAGDEIDSPLMISGESTAIEATVQVEIRLDGRDEPIFESFFSDGGAFGDMAPFETTFEWDPPEGGGAGALILSTFDPRDGWRSEATVLRVTFPNG